MSNSLLLQLNLPLLNYFIIKNALGKIIYFQLYFTCCLDYDMIGKLHLYYFPIGLIKLN